MPWIVVMDNCSSNIKLGSNDTFIKSLGTKLSDDDKTLPYLYWTPKLHKSPVKHRFIAGSSKCTSKQLSSLLTKILTVIKTGLEKYCSIKTSHTEVNNMWILKIPQIYCHLQVTWESTDQLLFKHSIFLPCTLPSHMIYSSLILTTSLTIPLNAKMELHNTPTSELVEIKAISPVIL